MSNKYMIIILGILIAFGVQAPANGAGKFGVQSSSKNVEWGFDFVETFDGLADWQGDCGVNGKWDRNLPQLSSGGNGPWDSYDQWTKSCDSGANWIEDFGSELVVGGAGKSLRMNIAGANQESPTQGVQRLVIYFGDTSASKPWTTGYDDFYLFYMLKIHESQWPTNINSSGTGSYSDGSGYAGFASWKLNSINMGQCDVHTRYHDNCGVSDTYSRFHATQHMKTGGAGNNLRLKSEPNDWSSFGSGYIGTVWGDIDIPSAFKSGNWIGWFGVEFHVQLVYEGGKYYWRQEAWLYDEAGNEMRQWSGNDSEYHSEYASHKINEVVLGGNNSNTYYWGSSMNPNYYIDNVIINGSRIGPQYYELASGSKALPVPGTPGGGDAPVIE